MHSKLRKIELAHNKHVFMFDIIVQIQHCKKKHWKIYKYTVLAKSSWIYLNNVLVFGINLSL